MANHDKSAYTGAAKTIRSSVEAVMTEATPLERREIHYSGWVQGVGFRYTARRIAGRHHVTGYVRNLRDGRVQLVVEATPEEVDRYVSELATTMEQYIRSADEKTTEATGEFPGFDIRF
jgi:acylphosphatase